MSTYSDGDIILALPNPLPPVVNLPLGWEVARVRFRQGELVTAFVRSADRFERWSLAWANEEHTALKLLFPMAANVRPKSQRKPNQP